VLSRPLFYRCRCAVFTIDTETVNIPVSWLLPYYKFSEWEMIAVSEHGCHFLYISVVENEYIGGAWFAPHI